MLLEKEIQLMDICTMINSLKVHLQKYIPLSEKELQLFSAVFKEVLVVKGPFLLQPGTTIRREHFVVKDCLKAYYINSKRNKCIIRFALENWWIGDFDTFYNPVSSPLFIEAIEDSELLTISYKQLQKIDTAAPIFERSFQFLTTQTFIAQRKGILSTQKKHTKERYSEFCNSYLNIKVRAANYDISNYQAVSSENLSSVQKSLKRF